MNADSNSTAELPAIVQTGFRPFFLGAMIYSIVAMGLWSLQLMQHTGLDLDTVGPALWHGHEMVFGYAMAVIAGFLLTAVQNWTGGKTAQGRTLLLLFGLWLVSRLLALAPSTELMRIMLVSSSLFYLLLLTALIRPLIAAGNKAQRGILGKLVLLFALDAVFLASACGWLDKAYARPALLIAVYTVIGLILVMAQRVVAPFTRNAINDGDRVREYRFVPQVSLIALLVFVLADIMSWQNLLLISGLICFAANAIRLYGWHSPEIWRLPLVWVLHMAILFITLGFLLRGTAHVFGMHASLGLHAMTYGGIGLVTTGMMTRVTLGHTGRNVFQPPAGIAAIFLLLTAGAVTRALLPLVAMEHYLLLVQMSQFLWIGAFVLMLVYLFEPLIRTRIEGGYG